MNRNSVILTATARTTRISADWMLWIIWAAFSALLVAGLTHFFPESIPYSFWGLWETSGTVSQWLIAAWPILLWAIGLNFIVAVFTRNTREENLNAESFLAAGVWLSLRAGIMEEIIFRWLIFMWSMALIQVSDFIFGGFLPFFDHGLVWAFYHYILSPLADFFTFGLLSVELSGNTAWYLAAGMLVANARFRDGHKYQGPLGVINSWFIGMYMFYLLFSFGLVAAIVVHLVYDVSIFGIRYLDRVVERARNVASD